MRSSSRSTSAFRSDSNSFSTPCVARALRLVRWTQPRSVAKFHVKVEMGTTKIDDSKQTGIETFFLCSSLNIKVKLWMLTCESQRDSGSKPGVARNELPWVDGAGT